MKRFSLLMLLAAATFALTGCMVTDYPCIEDQDYQNCTNEDPCEPDMVDTKGWAHIIEESMTATDHDGDGDYTQFLTFVSQDSSGSQMIATMVQNQGGYPPGLPPDGSGTTPDAGLDLDPPWCWHSDQYGNPAQRSSAPTPMPSTSIAPTSRQESPVQPEESDLANRETAVPATPVTSPATAWRARSTTSSPSTTSSARTA